MAIASYPHAYNAAVINRAGEDIQQKKVDELMKLARTSDSVHSAKDWESTAQQAAGAGGLPIPALTADELAKLAPGQLAPGQLGAS
jgi:hypothetical protein